MNKENLHRGICFFCEKFLQRTDICAVCRSETSRGKKPYWGLSKYHKKKYGICDKEDNK